MPFTKGDPETIKYAKMGARQGLMLEEKQLEKMRKLLDKYMLLAEKDELKPGDRDRMNRLEKLVLKAMDKLHPNKTDIKLDVEKPIMIL